MSNNKVEVQVDGSSLLQVPITISANPDALTAPIHNFDILVIDAEGTIALTETTFLSARSLQNKKSS